MKKLVLIDGHSILNRAFYGVPDLTNSAGQHTNAVYGFLNIMFKILDEEKADCLAVAFDLPAPTFRHKEYPEYKGTRKPMPEELHEQVPLIKEVLSSMDIPILSLEGYEADDIIGTIAKQYQKEGYEVSVVSGDRDLLQLSDEHIRIRIPKTSRGSTEVFDYYPEDVRKQYSVTPLEFIDVKALMGDASDNIPGVPSIGEKTATSIIEEYHSIENAYAHSDELKPPRAQKALKEHYKEAQFSKWLATIKLDVPIRTDPEKMELRNIYTPEAYREIKKLEFKSMLKRFDVSAKEDDNPFTSQGKIKIVTDRAEAEQIRSAVCSSEQFGMQLSDTGLSLSGDDGNVWFFRKGPSMDMEFLKEQAAAACGSGKHIFVLHLKPVLHFIGTEYRSNLEDCGIAAYLLNPLKESYDADDLARDFLDIELPSDAENADENSAYGSFSALKCGPLLLKKLAEEGMEKLYREIEMPLVFALAKMEKRGVKADGEKLTEFAVRLKEGISRAEEEIFAETGTEFNINSPKQLGEILFEKMMLPYAKKTKSGYSTSADILDKLAPDYPVVKKILEYRMLSKLNSTYATGLVPFIREDGRIHGTFNQTITATGRISSTEPNLQNIPIRTEMGSKIRGVFVPAEGNVFVDADYSQIELRVLASMSGDEALIDAYRHAVDIHTVTASNVFHVPLDEVTPAMRRNAKAVNFGVVYGISAFGLSEGLSISRREALDYINHYFKSYPKVKEFLDRQVKEAKENGFVTTLFGRRRPIPELKSSNFMQRSFGERVAMNSPIQGTAADIMKIAMIRVDRALAEKKLHAGIVLQIHDELLIEVRKDEAEEVRTLTENIMKHAADLKVDLEVDAHIGNSWLEAH